MKWKVIRLCFLFIAIGNSSFAQEITLRTIQQKNTTAYSVEKVKGFRRSSSVKTGAFQAANNTTGTLELMFYHSDFPQSGVQFRLQLGAGRSGYLVDKEGKRIVLGNDWGIQFGQNGWKSSVFLLDELVTHTGNGFVLTVTANNSESRTTGLVEQDDPENFKNTSEAKTYLQDNLNVTTEKREGKIWVDLLAMDYDEEEDYLMVVGKVIGRVPETLIKDQDEEAISKIASVSNSFKPMGLAWNKIQQIRVERDAKGDSWLVLSGPVEQIEDNKIIANRLRLLVSPKKTDNITSAIAFITKNNDRDKRRQAEEVERTNTEKQQKDQAQRDFENYRFTSVGEAATYLYKVLIAQTSHARTVKEKPVISYPNQYIVMPSTKENYQARYFSFSTIQQIEHVQERTPGCPGCGDIDLVKVTVPVYWSDLHEYWDKEFYFMVSDVGVEKAMKAFQYLKQNASFGEPPKKGSTQTVSESNSLYQVYFHNKNDFEVSVAYACDKNADGNITTHYWYTFAPGEEALLFTAKNRAYCFYAYGYNKSGKKKVWGNGEKGTMMINGQAKDATCRVIPAGQYKYSFSISSD